MMVAELKTAPSANNVARSVPGMGKVLGGKIPYRNALWMLGYLLLISSMMTNYRWPRYRRIQSFSLISSLFQRDITITNFMRFRCCCNGVDLWNDNKSCCCLLLDTWRKFLAMLRRPYFLSGILQSVIEISGFLFKCYFLRSNFNQIIPRLIHFELPQIMIKRMRGEMIWLRS